MRKNYSLKWGNALAVAALFLVSLASCDWLDLKNAPHALAKSARLEVCNVSSNSGPGFKSAIDPQSGSPIYLALPPLITSADVATIQRSDEASGSPSLSVQLTPTGAQKLSAATTPAQGQQLAIVVNGQVISVAQVLSPLSNGFRIAGGAIQKDREEIFSVLTER